MSSDNFCPACRKTYDIKPSRCMCGWYQIKEEAAKIDNSGCPFIESGAPCGRPASTSYKSVGKDYYCSTHAELLRVQSYKH